MALATNPKKRNSSFGLDDPEEFRATLGEHLDELRSRLLKIVYALVIASVLGWPVSIPIYEKLDSMVKAGIPPSLEYKETFHSFSGAFMLHLRMSVAIGIAVALPYALWQLWLFVKPGLKPHERKPVRLIFPLSLFLFLSGATVGWLMIRPTVGWFCSLFNEFKGAALYQEQGTMVLFLFKLMMAFGIAFQLPIVTFLLVKIGIIPAETLTRSWKHSTVAIFVLAMILTPSGDPFTMLAMAVPLTALFFGSIAAVKITSKKDGRSDEDHELNNLD